jgi:hypothetical protein
MKQQLSPMVVLIACIVAVALLASQSPRQTFEKISVREFELVDSKGKQRVSIKVEDNDEVVLRMRDQTGTIRIKMGADEAGSGLLLLDSETNPGLHVLAKTGATVSVTGKDGKVKTY